MCTGLSTSSGPSDDEEAQPAGVVYADFLERLAWLQSVSAAGPFEAGILVHDEPECARAAAAVLDALAAQRASSPSTPLPQLAVELGARAIDGQAVAPVFDHAINRLADLAAIQFRLKREQTLFFDSADSCEAPVAGRVTLNLARAAITSRRRPLFMNELRRVADQAVLAHCDRFAFQQPLFQSCPDAPIGFDFRNAAYVVGVTGLNECVEQLVGAPLHASEDAMALAEDILAHLREYLGQWSVGDGLQLVLGPTVDPAVSRRFDNHDRVRFGAALREGPGRSVANWQTTPGIGLAPNDLDAVEVAHREGRFHPLIDRGHDCRLTVPVSTPAEDLCALVCDVFRQTPCEALTLVAGTRGIETRSTA